MNHILSINSLSKHYGPLKAVDNLSLEIPKGSIYGILGPNGSGKTTTLGMIMDVIKPKSGSFNWFEGGALHDNLKRVGAILEHPNFYPYLDAIDNLKIIAEIKKIESPDYMAKLSLVNLADRANHKYKTYSLGMKQRLAIAGALLSDPEVLVLDEPTNGLDPKGIAEVRELIENIASTGVTILMASHILDEVEKVCSHVAVLKFGKLLRSGPVDEVISGDKWFELGSENLETMEKTLKALPGYYKSKIVEGKLLVWFNKELTASELNSTLHSHGHSLNHLQSKQTNLESFFLELTS